MKPFLHGKKCLNVSALRPPVGASVAGSSAQDRLGSLRPPSESPVPASAHVEVVKEGGKVVRLVVTCGCGERIEVECLYAPGT